MAQLHTQTWRFYDWIGPVRLIQWKWNLIEQIAKFIQIRKSPQTNFQKHFRLKSELIFEYILAQSKKTKNIPWLQKAALSTSHPLSRCQIVLTRRLLSHFFLHTKHFCYTLVLSHFLFIKNILTMFFLLLKKIKKLSQNCFFFYLISSSSNFFAFFLVQKFFSSSQKIFFS